MIGPTFIVLPQRIMLGNFRLRERWEMESVDVITGEENLGALGLLATLR